MPDLDQLRALGERLQPPSMADLEETARRRDRRRSLTAVAGGLTAILAVAGGALALSSQDRERTLPEISTPTPTVVSTPTSVPSPESEPTHQSDTSMTPREVVLSDNAELAYVGISADDPDFRISVWTAECTWCPKLGDSPLRPRFKAIAVTTDGFETATYARPPRGAAGIFYVYSPAAGVLLIVDPANGGEWLVHEDGSTTVVERVVEDRPADEPRQWFKCLSTEVGQPDYLDTWCALDVDAATAYEWREPWSQEPSLVASGVDPGVGVEPWGRALMSADGDRELKAWFYRDGERQTRLLATAPSGSGSGGFTGDMVLGAREDLLYWSHVRGTDVLTFHVGDDGGASWRDIEQSLPSSDISTEELLATPEGAILLRHIAYGHGHARARIWRLESLEEGEWDLVHDTGDLPYTYDLGLMRQLTVVGTRIMLGALYSDNDGRTWTQASKWR